MYDLIRDLARSLCASVTRAVLDAEAEGICATLVLEHEGVEFSLPCHPADAIALALLTSTPIYATADALAHACPLARRERQEIDDVGFVSAVIAELVRTHGVDERSTLTAIPRTGPACAARPTPRARGC